METATGITGDALNITNDVFGLKSSVRNGIMAVNEFREQRSPVRADIMEESNISALSSFC